MDNKLIKNILHLIRDTTHILKMTNKIGAIILTMNRKEMVTECIKSLITEKLNNIIVVDNGSSDGTVQHLKSNFNNKKITIIPLKKNIGSSGGYNIGLKKAHKIGVKWVWIFDDDCEAIKGSLKNLKHIKKFLEKKGEKIGFIASKLNWIGGGAMPSKINLNSKKWADYLDYSLLRIKWSVYTGLFVNMDAVKKNGLPKKDFFLPVPFIVTWHAIRSATIKKKQYKRKRLLNKIAARSKGNDARIK